MIFGRFAQKYLPKLENIFAKIFRKTKISWKCKCLDDLKRNFAISRKWNPISVTNYAKTTSHWSPSSSMAPEHTVVHINKQKAAASISFLRRRARQYTFLRVATGYLFICRERHGLNNFKDTKPQMSSLRVFNRVNIRKIQSFLLVFATGFVNQCPSNLFSS